MLQEFAEVVGTPSIYSLVDKARLFACVLVSHGSKNTVNVSGGGGPADTLRYIFI